MESVKMFLFARWIATCYADEHIDENMVSQHTFGYNPNESMSVLNRESGEWWKRQLKHFNDVVYPSYVKNGGMENAFEFLHGHKLYCECDRPWGIEGMCSLCYRPIKISNYKPLK